MGQRRTRRGISLLELLFTISLLTVVLVVFAAVYPSGYKLNRKSAKANVAVATATAVAAELQGLPFSDERTDFPTLNRMASDPVSKTTFVQSQMRTKLPEGFTVPTPDGIEVQVHPTVAEAAALPGNVTVPRVAYLTVTIYWTDVNDMSLQRHVSVTTSKTDNLVGR